ncbi:MAG: glutamine-hydrolyzing GMP synthase [Dysgonamonadaceae bacterium]|jgi:GMP synthase (glutamine-hydrolysing)|nr:glutamine-hydrolyzing GMP synthase [Dysgonamonadaceae bacterium]
MIEKIIILDCGSQTTQLIARRLRELNVYCEIVPYNKFPHNDNNIIGVIISGSPFSTNDPNAFKPNLENIRGKYPTLGICYGAQYIAYSDGGTVGKSNHREYGRAQLSHVDNNNPLTQNVANGAQVWMSHGDTITKLPENFSTIAQTDNIKTAAYKVNDEPTWGVQFHPEVYHTEIGTTLLNNFLEICNATKNWTPISFIETTVEQLKQQLGNNKVILALSGGVDSSVCAVLLNKAVGKNLTCIFVDNGLLRKNEFETVLQDYHSLNLDVKGIDAKQYFYRSLKGVADPEQKRKIIGKCFIDVFEQEAGKIKNALYLAQGTIYPDIIESLSITGMTIKSHHNVGGLPDKMNLKIVEPLRLLFKDEVRRVGHELGMENRLINRHPFPGPGLAVRILGDVTPDKIKILQDADDVFIRNLRENNLYDKVWQAGAILLPVNSVGVMGDERTYENAVALRAVVSTDAMTADWAHLPYQVLAKVSNEIINKVKGVNRVVYDISSKPPSTIEWE